MALSILDVLENALDGDLSAETARRMSMQQVRDLRDAVLDFYDAWAPYPPPADTLRAHLGGWIATQAGGDGLARDLLHAGLLYAHEVVIHDPVAAYFEPRRRQLTAFRPVIGVDINSEASAVHEERTAGYEQFLGNLEAHRSHLSIAIPQIAHLGPLIRAGVVLPIPHLKLTLQRQTKIWGAVLQLLNDPQYIRTLEHPVDRGALTRDQGASVQLLTQPRTQQDALIQQHGDAAYYLARSVALADASYATYLPPSATEWAIYEQRLRRLQLALDKRSTLDLTVAPALLQAKLPYFRDLRTPDLVGARRDDEAFGQWRLALRRAIRSVTSLPSNGQAFTDEVEDVLKEELDERAAQVRAATSRSGTLARHARTGLLNFGAGAATIGVTSATGGAPPSFSSLAINTFLQWIGETVFSRGQSGSRAVLAHLVQPRETLGEDEWPKREPLFIEPKKRPS